MFISLKGFSQMQIFPADIQTQKTYPQQCLIFGGLPSMIAVSLITSEELDLIDYLPFPSI